VAIMGATAVEFAENYNKISAGQMPLAAFAIGAVISCLVGIIALKLLIKSSRKANLKFFAFYCYILAAFVLVYLLR
ncbi:MAG: UDP-diphosphatase, partial [Planctomycetes bacterium]|nr:UDP-diphosphatase [Planctomycetota bacterium]